MELLHRLTRYHESSGSITVNYYIPEFPEGWYVNIDLPVEDGKLIADQETIDGLIRIFAPSAQVERLYSIKNTPVPENLAYLILVSNEPAITKAPTGQEAKDATEQLPIAFI